MSDQRREITPEEEALFPGHCEPWKPVSDNTSPMDFNACEPAVVDCFEVCDMGKPLQILPARSPHEALNMAVAVKKLDIDMREWSDSVEREVMDFAGRIHGNLDAPENDIRGSLRPELTQVRSGHAGPRMSRSSGTC